MGVLDVVIPYDPRPLQRTLHQALDSHRFGVAVCHRRFGKTVLAVNQLQKGALTCKRPRPRFAYIAPTYRQGKAVAWDYMKHFAAPIPGIKTNESDLKIDFPNGGQVRIYGADNPDALRGIYLDGVVLDEYGLMGPTVFNEVIRPLLADREGWAFFIGTPNGKNQFYDAVQTAQREPDWFFHAFKASETGYVNEAELQAAQRVMTPDQYAQEFECSFEASVKGSIFGREVVKAKEDGRVTRVPYDPMLPVDTDWDLGMGDATAIWFSQSLRAGEIRLIDYYENTGEGLAHYRQVLNEKGYTYGNHWAPHDIEVRELGTGHSRKEAAFSLGLNFLVTPRLEKKEDGIHAARMIFPRCYFDRDKCAQGIEALQHYRWDFNTRINEFTHLPVHDWASHAADAFQGFGYRHYLNMRSPERQAAADLRKAQRDTDPYTWGHAGRWGRGGMQRRG
jgi:phage terminase large subunit